MKAIDETLTQADASAPDIHEVARLRKVRGQGIFHVHDVEINGKDGLWVAKWPNHERQAERRLLFIELIVVRLGHLFTPRLTPEYVLATTAEKLRINCPVEAVQICGKRLGEGTAFATHLEEGRASWKRVPGLKQTHFFGR